MPSHRTIYSGIPGTIWTNDTERPQYQLVVSLINSCGVCIQYHLKIGSPWPIPFHWGCLCEQRIIKVGAQAPHPFCDYMEVIDKLPPEMRGKVVGVSNLILIKKGVVTWSDVVTGSRVRDLREVADRHDLSVERMVKAGIKPSIAAEAHAAVHTSEHETRRAPA